MGSCSEHRVDSVPSRLRPLESYRDVDPTGFDRLVEFTWLLPAHFYGDTVGDGAMTGPRRTTLAQNARAVRQAHTQNASA